MPPASEKSSVREIESSATDVGGETTVAGDQSGDALQEERDQHLIVVGEGEDPVAMGVDVNEAQCDDQTSGDKGLPVSQVLTHGDDGDYTERKWNR